MYIFCFYHRTGSDSDDEQDVEDLYPSLESVPSDNSLTLTNKVAPHKTVPLTEAILDELSNTLLDRQSKITKIEDILISEILDNDEVSNNVFLVFDWLKLFSPYILFQNSSTDTTKAALNTNLYLSSNDIRKVEEKACQTLSTGDIVITKIFFQEQPDKPSN